MSTKIVIYKAIEQLNSEAERIAIEDIDVISEVYVENVSAIEKNMDNLINSEEGSLPKKRLREFKNKISTLKDCLMEYFVKILKYKEHKRIRTEKIQLLDEMEENGQHVDEGVRELQANSLEEINNSISELSSKIEIERKDMRTQLDMIRSLMRKLRGSELTHTHTKKIAAIFREQGVSVAAILTAIVATIAAIIESLASIGAAKAAIPATGSPKPPGVLDNLKNALLWLADKAASALPGIIDFKCCWLAR